jgi:hypothetical protein
MKKRTYRVLRILLATLSFLSGYILTDRYLLYGRKLFRVNDAALVPLEAEVEHGALGQDGVVQFEDAQQQQQYKTYRFYDAGFLYHDVNFTCPVPWVCCVSIFEYIQSFLTAISIMLCRNGRQI